jgi:uncharacterized protein YegJ (DUF2314 family)
MSVQWLIFAVLLAVAAGTWFRREKRKQGKEVAPESIVLLLRRPKPLNVYVLADLLSRESGRAVRPIDIMNDGNEREGDRPAGDCVAGASPHFIVQIGGTAFTVHNIPTPYVEDPVKASGSLSELRLRKAVRDHQAWLSMDILHSQAATAEAYRMAAKVLAHFVDDDCLALYHPPLCQFAPCNADETIEKLRSDDPIRAVFREITSVPVIPLDDDPRLKAAEAEARRRFAEFASAFELKEGTAFAVKARISAEGNSEHIWIEVDRISGDKIEGRLGNDPVELGDLKIGSKVEIETNQVEDWAILRDDAPVGMFTMPVIEQIERERSGEKQ